MNSKTCCVPFLSGVLLLAYVLGQVGCEENSDVVVDTSSSTNEPVFAISPSSATLHVGESNIVFTTVGGIAPFEWSVSDQALGTLTVSNAAVVTYRKAGTGTGVNVIRVTDSKEWVASATVTHTDIATGPLSISPGSTNLTGATDSVTFTASEGTPPYDWTVDDSSLGSITPYGSSYDTTALYLRTAETGTAHVTVSDDIGSRATAIVFQE